MADDKRTCVRCGSSDLRIGALARERGQVVEVRLLLGEGRVGYDPGPFQCDIEAAMCVICGHVELFVEDPAAAARGADATLRSR